jgi:hypothetical protein
MSENLNTEPLEAFERALSQFTPAPPSIDRDRLMFLAGKASAAPGTQYSVLSTQYFGRKWLWPASTAVCAATSLALAVALFLRPTPHTIVVSRELPVILPAPSAAQAIASQPDPPVLIARAVDFKTPVAANTYLKTREVALRMGLDALGSPAYSAEPAEASTYRDLWLGFISATRSPDSASDQTDKQTRM